MPPSCPAWLRSAIIYNIYPQSFHDANGDGIGDLPGILSKLDYIKSLGVNCIWLNPIYASPFGDAGYDVADFCKVAPRYGTNEDARALFEAAHERGIRVILDFVAGHTSDQHPWFQASARPEPNRYGNRYVWTAETFGPTPEGEYIGGYSDRDGRYLANFFYFQPALNYGWAYPQHDWQLPTDHPDVLALKQDMRDILRFWLDLGADGFRVDMAASLVKGDPDSAATMQYWRGERDWLQSEYPEAVLIAEWSHPKDALGCGFHVDFMIHSGTSVYTTLFRAEQGRNVFPGDGHSFFDRAGKGDIRAFLDTYIHHLNTTREQGYISIPTGNHDLPRLNSGRSEEELRVALAFVLTMPGVPQLYYGDEIGMRNLDGLTSKEGAYIRTGARTPMQWDASPNAGFSAAPPNQLYLPVDPEADRPTVARQDPAPESLLNFVRSLTALRRQLQPLGADGEFLPLFAESEAYPFVYARRLDDVVALVALNPADAKQSCTVRPPNSISAVPPLERLAGTATASAQGGAFTFEMPPISFGIWRM